MPAVYLLFSYLSCGPATAVRGCGVKIMTERSLHVNEPRQNVIALFDSSRIAPFPPSLRSRMRRIVFLRKNNGMSDRTPSSETRTDEVIIRAEAWLDRLESITLKLEKLMAAEEEKRTHGGH